VRGRAFLMLISALSLSAGCPEDTQTATTHVGVVDLPPSATTSLTVTAQGEDVAIEGGRFIVTSPAGASPWLLIAKSDGVPVGLSLVRPSDPTVPVSCRETARSYIAIRSGLFTLPDPYFELSLDALDETAALDTLDAALCAALEADPAALTTDDPTLDAAVVDAVEGAMSALTPQMQGPPIQALVHVDWPGSDSKMQWIDKVVADDPGDTTFPEAENHVFFRVRNTARRYVGVTVETSTPGAGWTYVDNGVDDHTVEPGPAPASLEGVMAVLSGIAEYLVDDRDVAESTVYKERVYAVPASTDALEPGESMKVRFKLMGLSLGASEPLDWIDAGGVQLAEPERAVMTRSVGLTLSLVPLRSLLKLFSGVDKTFEAVTAEDTFPADLWELLQGSPQLWDKLQKRDIGGLVWELIKYAGSAESARWFFDQSMQRLFEELDQMSAVAGPYVLTANTANALLDLYESPWIETWTATITRPRIDATSPNEDVDTGDVVTVDGVGFDADSPEDTLVYVSEEGQLIPGATLRVPQASVTVLSERELTFVLPPGWGEGPIQVSVDGLRSNDHPFPGEPPPWAEVVAVKDYWGIDQLFDGVATVTDVDPDDPGIWDGVIVVKLHDTPEQWPARPAAAYAVMDGKWVGEMTQVSTETFEIPFGVYSWMEAGQSYTYSLPIYFDCEFPANWHNVSPDEHCAGPRAGSSPESSSTPSVRIRKAAAAP